MSVSQPPLKGEDGASRRRGQPRYAEYHSGNPRRIRTDPRCPLWGKCREAAKGVPLVFLSRHHSSNNTPSVSLAGSEVPSSLPAPPLGSQVGCCEFAQGFIKPQVPAATPQSGRSACQLPFQGRFSRCPLWGWCSAQRIKIVMIAGGNHTSVSCRAAAKGVPLVILSCCHSSNHTPSVSLAGSEVPSSLPAPPSGSQGPLRF